MNIYRRQTKQIKLGNLTIGSGNPVYIQSMPKLSLTDSGIIDRILEMQQRGCDIIRTAVKDKKNAEGIKKVKKETNIPLIADIHFDYRLALISIDNGADGIRLNPGNIFDKDKIKIITKRALASGVPIRVGTNSGSLEKVKLISNQSWAKKLCKFILSGRQDTVDLMTALTLDYINLLESLGFDTIMAAIKSHDVRQTMLSNKKLSEECDYPIQLGVTAAGLYEIGIVKSSMGIGALLANGIGDIIRVSLTGDPFCEIDAAKNILKCLGIAKKTEIEIIACPVCARSSVDVKEIVSELSKRIFDENLQELPLKVAVMGCEVNGPGEAKHADIGIAGGNKNFLLFKNGKALKKIPSHEAVEELIQYLKKWCY